jgi:hypothetical protein
MLTINFVSVLVAAVVAFVVGFLLHGPVLGKVWMKLADIHPTGNEKLSDMIPQMAWNLVANIVTACVLAIMYSFVSTSSYGNGAGIATAIKTAVLVWFGFIVASSSMEVIWMGRKMKLWLFECMCSLIVLTAMGIVIASM